MKTLTHPLETDPLNQKASSISEQNGPLNYAAITKCTRRGRRCLTEPSEVHQKMIELSKSLTASEIARHFEVSRQRVHQIFRRWSYLCPKRVIVSKSKVAVPVEPRRERREVIVCFRLTSQQVEDAKELLGGLGIRKEISHNAACRAVLLIAMNSLFSNSNAANAGRLEVFRGIQRAGMNRGQ